MPIDQVDQIINMLKTEPNSRRIIMSAWNPAEVEMAALPWCHTLYQFYVNDGKLSCQLYQRSGDLALGVPFNWVSASMLVHILAKLTNLEVGEFIWTGGDIHIYENQIEALKTQFERKTHPLAQVHIKDTLTDINSIKFEDIEILNYESEPFIKIPVSK
jgi:thymidylate synthase